MKTLEKIFGNNTHIKLILLFYNNNNYFDNITGLVRVLGKSHVTVRKVVSDLIDAGILTEMKIGKSRMIKINKDNPYTEALFDFINSMQNIREEEEYWSRFRYRALKRNSSRGRQR